MKYFGYFLYTKTKQYSIGNVLLSFQLVLRPNVLLQKWNLTPNVPEPNDFYDNKGYFVMMTKGLDVNSTVVVLDLMVSVSLILSLSLTKYFLIFLG